MNLQLKSFLKRWFIPEGYHDIYSKLKDRVVIPDQNLIYMQKILEANKKFRGLHQGQRCFIVCNGPSVSKQDLLLLKKEIVFSVSSGYHHKQYNDYKPNYHCTPQLTYSEYFTKDTAISWFKEMHEKTGDAHLFFGYQEEQLIRENALFPGRDLSFISMHGDFEDIDDLCSIDISRTVPQVCSVPIMSIMIAIYMGFKDIYLIGAEHDSFAKREYKYFFEHTVLKERMQGVDRNDKITTPICEELYIYYRLFRQYRSLRNIAEKFGVNLYNSTLGGALDELERVSYESIWT